MTALAVVTLGVMTLAAATTVTPTAVAPATAVTATAAATAAAAAAENVGLRRDGRIAARVVHAIEADRRIVENDGQDVLHVLGAHAGEPGRRERGIGICRERAARVGVTEQAEDEVQQGLGRCHEWFLLDR